MRTFGMMILLAVSSHAAGALAQDVGALERHLQALAAQLDPRAISALAAIDGTGRRLLAARSYQRSAAHLTERWSWSESEVAAFNLSPGRAQLDAAIHRVRCEFGNANPGHTLFVNPAFRSLEVQIRNWNGNESVSAASNSMADVLRAAVETPDFPAPGSPEGIRRFRQMLDSYRPEPAPTIAAPGLSLHGQMHAIDFQVQANGSTIAGPSTRSIERDWERAGWTTRLRSAVTAAGVGFAGPLHDPYEPWHYDFRPQSGSGPGAACERRL
jgi:hypothetical protein